MRNSKTDRLDHFEVIDIIFLEDVFEVFGSPKYTVLQRLWRKFKAKFEPKNHGLLSGSAGQINGFNFVVYSNDHGRHFHVIHKAQGIDARFSFPEIDLISYKNSRNRISRKIAGKIHSYFQDSQNFARLDFEFKKRSL